MTMTPPEDVHLGRFQRIRLTQDRPGTEAFAAPGCHTEGSPPPHPRSRSVLPSPRVLLRRLAVTEAVTWALLLTGMFLKYVVGTTELGVRVAGPLHGVAFVAYGVGVLAVAHDQRWRAGTTLLALAAAVPPFLTVWFERGAGRRGLLADAWRLGPAGEPPRTAPERLQAWMLRRPGLAVAIGLAVVGLLTGAALLAGPPVPSAS
jgi:integral membrane protein